MGTLHFPFRNRLMKSCLIVTDAQDSFRRCSFYTARDVPAWLEAVAP